MKKIIECAKTKLNELEELYTKTIKTIPVNSEELKRLEIEYVHARVRLALLEARRKESSPFMIKVCPDIVLVINESWLLFSYFDVSESCELKTKDFLSVEKLAEFHRGLNDFMCALIQPYYDINYLKALIEKYANSKQVDKEDIIKYKKDETIKEKAEEFLSFLHSDKMNILSSVIHEYIEAYMRIEGLK